MQLGVLLVALAAPLEGPATAASSEQPGFGASGAVDGDRFSFAEGHAWRGKAGEAAWWWEERFQRPRRVAAILQVIGAHAFVLRGAPRDYVWLASRDGTAWEEIAETRTRGERRLFRLHRLKEALEVSALRLRVDACEGDSPALREVEVFDAPSADVTFPPWIIAVNTTHDRKLPGQGQEFIPLARSCPGWEKLEAQQVWVGDFDEAFASAEPRPLCAFLSGNFKDWCEVDRSSWRGLEEVLRARRLPMWASCGGAQGLAILSEVGTDKPWDCPHCRDPGAPKLPIYGHIGHRADAGGSSKLACGDYSACVFERGPHLVRRTARDPVFDGLPDDFQVMESHCGQIEWPPAGWVLIATAGEGTRTRMQCLRVKDRYVYAAQFHIEMEGTPEVSRRIAGSFLELARSWGGYNPGGKAVPEPEGRR